MNLNQLADDATTRLQHHINRSAGQHLRAINKAALDAEFEKLRRIQRTERELQAKADALTRQEAHIRNLTGDFT